LKVLVMYMFLLKPHKHMKKYIFIISILLNGCISAKFKVTHKELCHIKKDCVVCVVNVEPINKKAKKLTHLDKVMVNCNEYIVGDVLKLNYKNFKKN
jgi:hypothetical protein